MNIIASFAVRFFQMFVFFGIITLSFVQSNAQNTNVVNDSIGVYEGETNEDGFPHGYGIMRYTNGGIYKGYWKNGLREGYGEMEINSSERSNSLSDNPIGTEYHGYFRDDKRSGPGILYLLNPESELNKEYNIDKQYCENWENDEKNGKGFDVRYNYWGTQDSDGNHPIKFHFSGEWVNNERHGESIVYRTSGSLGRDHRSKYRYKRIYNMGKMIEETLIEYQSDLMDEWAKSMTQTMSALKEATKEVFRESSNESNSSTSNPVTYKLGEWKSAGGLLETSVHDPYKISITFNCKGYDWKEYIGRDLSNQNPYSAGVNTCDGLFGNKRFKSLDKAIENTIECRCN